MSPPRSGAAAAAPRAARGGAATPRLRRLRRAELPVDTQALARFLVGKVLVREDAQGCASKTTSFTGGEAHATFSGATKGYVKVVWANCDLPTYTYVPQ